MKDENTVTICMNEKQLTENNIKRLLLANPSVNCVFFITKEWEDFTFSSRYIVPAREPREIKDLSCLAAEVYRQLTEMLKMKIEEGYKAPECRVKRDYGIEAGSTVKLKSGGPRMTVLQVNGDQEIRCAWDLCGCVQRSAFPAVCLEVMDNEGKHKPYKTRKLTDKEKQEIFDAFLEFHEGGKNV